MRIEYHHHHHPYPFSSELIARVDQHLSTHGTLAFHYASLLLPSLHEK